MGQDLECAHCGEPISLGNMGSMCGKRTPSGPCTATCCLAFRMTGQHSVDCTLTSDLGERCPDLSCTYGGGSLCLRCGFPHGFSERDLLKGEPTPVRALVAPDLWKQIEENTESEEITDICEAYGGLVVENYEFLPPGYMMVQYSDGSFLVRGGDGCEYTIGPPLNACESRLYGQVTKLTLPMRDPMPRRRPPGW